MSLFADVAARPEFRRFNREREPRLGNYSSVRSPHIEFCRRVSFVETSRCVYSLTRVDLDCDYLHTLYIFHSNGRRSVSGVVAV